jgi:large subunit ribosomal protein L18
MGYTHVSIQRKIKSRTERRALRVRSALKENSILPRLSVFRSLKHMYAQIIDDAAGKTLASCSSLELKDVSGDKKAIARSVGLELANRAKKNGIQAAVFDRGSYLYHGRLKSLAEGVREGGLTI